MAVIGIRRSARRIAGAALSVALLYALAAIVLGLVPINRGFVQADGGIEVFLLTNGVHAGLAVPLVAATSDLSRDFPPPSGRRASESAYVMIGWGDRRIYPETRVWADLRPTSALTAMLGLNGAVMHIEHVGRPEPSPTSVPIRLSEAAYGRLVTHISGSLQRDPRGNAVRLEGASHGRQDAFYAARGRYNPFYTCNGWVRQGLAEAGVRTALWSPADAALFHHVRR